MKRFAFLLLFLALLLPACAPVAPTQTSEVAETSEVLPSSTPRPTERPTITPTSIDMMATLVVQKLKYTPEELSSFPGGVTEQEITIGEETQNALVGVRQDGTERVLALEINGVMTRVGEWTDADGHTFYVYVNPDYDPLHRILATEQTPETLTNFLFEALATGQFANDAGGDGNALKTILFNKENGGRVFLDLPVADPENGDWPVKWIQSETEADFSKPIEVMTVFGKDADEFMKTSPLAKYIMDDRGNTTYIGGLIWVAEDGHIQIIVMNNGPTGDGGLRYVPTNPSEKNTVLKVLREFTAKDLFSTLKTFEYYQNPDAYLNTRKSPASSSGEYTLWGFSVDLP